MRRTLSGLIPKLEVLLEAATSHIAYHVDGLDEQLAQQGVTLHKSECQWAFKREREGS